MFYFICLFVFFRAVQFVWVPLLESYTENFTMFNALESDQFFVKTVTTSSTLVNFLLLVF